jgi:small-conductance mechanosensitive channel
VFEGEVLLVLFLILFLLLFVFFPWLLLPLFVFLLINLLLLPFSFTFRSLLSLMTIPGQIWQIATNRHLRSNHALEHATINVIEEHYGAQQLAGFAQEDGFFIKGPVQPHLIENAARIGLRRLQQGEKHLAIHRRCGTTMAAANFLSAIVFLTLLVITGQFTLVNVLPAILIANLVGPVFGIWLQQHLTTSSDVDKLEIVGVEYRVPAFRVFPGALGFVPTEFFVRTQQKSRR